MKPISRGPAVAAVVLLVAMAAPVVALLGLGRSPTYTGSPDNPSVAGPVAASPAAARRMAEPMAIIAADGKAISLDDFRGRVVLVNLWAGWCAPCIAEMPALDALDATLGGPRFQVVAVALDHGGIDTARGWLARNGLGHLAAFAADPGRFPDAVLPTTWLIDRRGRVAWHGLGARAWDQPVVQAEIGRLIAE